MRLAEDAELPQSQAGGAQGSWLCPPPQGTCPLLKPNTCSAPIPQPINFPRPSRWWLGALPGVRDVLPSVFLGMLRLVGGLGHGWEQKGL